MPRFDKVDSAIGGTRARLAADVAEADWNKVLGVGLDASGHATPKAASQTGFVGVAIFDRTTRKAGTPIDIMRQGEIVDVPSLAAGTVYYLDANGALTASAPAAGVNAVQVGHTVEADRLVVNIQNAQGAT